MADSIAGVYSDARSEYTKQLCGILVPSYFQFYLTILEKAKEESIKTNDPKKLLWHFQTFLNDIPEWNMEKVNTEIGQLQTSCGCDYLEDLLTAVFIAHTKVLTAIRVSNKQKKVQITVPKVEHFLFKVLCETSKLLWGSSFLFREGIPAIEKQQNYRSVEALLGEGILQAVRSMVPVKSILRDFVSMDDGDEEKALEEDKEVEEAKVVEPKTVLDISANRVIPKAVLDISANSVVATNEIIISESDVSSNEAPLIRIDTGTRVGFADYNSFFDSENDHGSDLLPSSTEEAESKGLEILDDIGTPLDLNDVEDLNPAEDKPFDIGADDYDVLP
jgi:hypothetical protein